MRSIPAPSVITAAGNKPKLIEEFVGRATTGTAAVSIARMKSPAGWMEPGQRPDFDEYTVVLSGMLRVTTREGALDVGAGQAVHTSPGEWVQYSTPEPGGAEYVAVCLPAFSPDNVHRDAPVAAPGAAAQAAPGGGPSRAPAIGTEEAMALLARNAEIVARLAACPEEQARWRPAPDRWSVLEVVNHLLDEEREDFRLRLDLLLHDPSREWPKIDPQAWVTQRGYNECDPAESLAGFLAERRASLQWFADLRAPDWSLSRSHPPFGDIHAGDLLVAWLRHDLVHIRQLVNLLAEHEKARGLPYRTDYAGA